MADFLFSKSNIYNSRYLYKGQEEQALGSRRMRSNQVLQTVFNCGVHHCVVRVVRCVLGHEELTLHNITQQLDGLATHLQTTPTCPFSFCCLPNSAGF